ncbi:MAG: sodium-dependent transporter [Candidatus Riflebacteria bacterium]|nr:sodium-dependent transporter [Candidatus Riflebacteria bacterium]
MKDNIKTLRENWGSNLGFIMAAAGSAVGLGNLWKFPYLAGKNGGAAFVFVYMILALTVGSSLILAEVAIGRYTGLNPVGAYQKINKKWGIGGKIQVLASFLMLSYYCVVGGWIVKYMVVSFSRLFINSSSSSLEYKAVFENFISSPIEPVVYLGIYISLNLIIVGAGVKNGIEKASKILMPALMCILLVILARSLTLEGAQKGVSFFLKPDFSKITFDVILAAMGQVFLSLSIGLGSMTTYGSYLSKKENILKSAAIVPVIDTIFAIVAGLCILPAVFALGFSPSEGPGLIFITLPAVFEKMSFGHFFSIAFFMLALFAAVTSSISILETCVCYLVDDKKISRLKGSISCVLTAFLVGLPCSLSFGPMSTYEIIGSRNIFNSMDFLVCNMMLPMGGILICILAGWVWDKQKHIENGHSPIEEVTNNGKIRFPLGKLWLFFIRWIAPGAIIFVFISSAMK